MRKGSKATNPYFCETIARMLRACEGLSAAGEGITYRKLSDMTGLTARAMQYRVARLRKAGRFPYKIDVSSTDALYAEAIAAAAAIAASGGILTCRAIAESMGCSPEEAAMRVGAARRAGRFPWEIAPAPRMTIEERAGRDRAARERRMAKIELKGREPIEELDAMVRANKAIVLAEHRAGMIDGTLEQDDTPPGIPPRSNKDHAAWGRMRFQDLHGGGYEPRRSRDFRPMGGGR